MCCIQQLTRNPCDVALYYHTLLFLATEGTPRQGQLYLSVES
jgi:hypothetical protein